MGSSSKNLKQSFLPHGALARGRGQSLKSMGSVRVTAEKRTLIDPTNKMLETLRSKSVQGTSIGKSKGCSTTYSDRNELASEKNLMQPGLDLIEDETSFPHENLDVMQETAISKPAKEKGQNFTSVCSSKESKNLMPPGFDPIEVDTLISYDDLEVMGRGKGFTSLSSVGGSVEKRKMIGNNKEKDIRQTFTSMGSVKGSIVVQGTSIGKSKDCSAAYSDRNELASDKNLVQPGLDLIEDETSFPHENLDVMQKTARSKLAKEKGQNFTSVCFSKKSKNLMQPGFDPIEVDTLISYDDLEVMGRGKRFISLSSVRGSVEKRKMIENNKGLNSAGYDQNIVAQKTNVVPPYFDAIECDTSFPHDNHEVMQDTLRRKSGKANRGIFTSVDSGRGSTFQQRTSIRTSKGYSAVSSDTNVLAHNKNLRQPDFSQIEHDTAFPHDDLEVMQQDLRSKSGPNLCKVVQDLNPKSLESLFIIIEVVGDHHALFLRHLGSLVRDRNMCPFAGTLMDVSKLIWNTCVP
ncbi:hypothetical protein H5410_057458 [Solanum commersonii]|uniref:Uncharacterized protein n=1 Tax=Solanum commersonii TaxID=4109 RepID=A0A9J5WQ83_SOLCO|nr:hypothetical protein H5410_057458 [Solanum commersonii]